MNIPGIACQRRSAVQSVPTDTTSLSRLSQFYLTTTTIPRGSFNQRRIDSRDATREIIPRGPSIGGRNFAYRDYRARAHNSISPPRESLGSSSRTTARGVTPARDDGSGRRNRSAPDGTERRFGGACTCTRFSSPSLRGIRRVAVPARGHRAGRGFNKKKERKKRREEAMRRRLYLHAVITYRARGRKILSLTSERVGKKSQGV